MKSGGSTSDAIYGLGIVGALVYFVQQATTFWDFPLALLKALLWPALLIYHALLALSV